MGKLSAIFVIILLAFQLPGKALGSEGEALAAINAFRQAHGCGPLAIQNQLLAAAQRQARNMAEHDYFGHESPDGSKFSKRFRAAGYRGGHMAENIAAGYSSGQKVAEVWINSPKHRNNILNCAYSETGIGVFYQADDAPLPGQSHAMKYYWVQTFGAP